MKRIRAPGLLTVILLAVGAGAACAAQAKWIKANATAEDYRRDVSWCNGAAELEVGYLPDSEHYRSYAVAFETFEACMRERGWRREGEPEKTSQ